MRAFLRRWVLCSAAGAASVSLVDAALLQRRESYFTGGFLSADHLTGPLEIAAFFALSVLVDAAVIGILAAAVMWTFGRLRPRASLVAAFLAGVLPLLAADVVEYELVRYLGDAVDLSLMFELTGRSVAEMLAVASSHLVAPVVVGLFGVGACGVVVWIVNRSEAGPPPSRPALRALLVPLAAFVLTLGVATESSAAHDRLEAGIVRKPSGRLMALIADRLTDIDGDGFGISSRIPDPDPRDPRIYPYAPDVPGNGIDEDGVGGDLPAGVAPYVEGPPPLAWQRRPDVVLVVLESFRFDVVGSTLGGRPVTPVLDGLARNGVASAHAYSHNGYTAQSRFHLLTGSLAGVRPHGSLVDDFRANGYTTVYISGQDDSFGGPRYDGGFARADVAIDARADRDRRYSTFTTAGSLAVPFTVVEEHVRESLRDKVPADKPLFLYVNFHDTHFPYAHDAIDSIVSPVRLSRGDIGPDARSDLRAMYVNTAANVDRAIGSVLEEVRRTRGREPAVVVTGDHGESLFDDSFLGHGYALNDVQTQVPLIVANLPMLVEEPFGQNDLRDAIGAALSVPETAHRAPEVQATGRQVFQYLGNINRPRQIALRGRDRRIVYDFRTRRVQRDDGAWQAPAELSGSAADDFRGLIQLWERMMLARAAAAGS